MELVKKKNPTDADLLLSHLLNICRSKSDYPNISKANVFSKEHIYIHMDTQRYDNAFSVNQIVNYWLSVWYNFCDLIIHSLE